jgi:hypothetical protein
MTLEQACAFVGRYGRELRTLCDRVAADLAKDYKPYDASGRTYSAEEHIRIRSGRQSGRTAVLAGQVSYQQSSSRPFAAALLFVDWESEEVFAEAADEQPKRTWRVNDEGT